MTGNQAAVFIDRSCLVLMCIMPIWAVIRFRIFGVFAGAAFSWLLGLLGRWVITEDCSSFDERGNIMWLLWLLWLLTGLIVCIGYSALLYALTLPFRKKQRAEQPDEQMPTTSSATPVAWHRNLPRLHPQIRY
jgi:hypothetical protein